MFVFMIKIKEKYNWLNLILNYLIKLEKECLVQIKENKTIM